MRLPIHWLHDHCAPALTPRELAERLDLTGTEVARVEPYGVSALTHFVVGRVLSAEPHPDADRLTVCAVDVGEESPSTIVCGAPNVAAGQTVAVARPGAVMPDGTELGAAKLRGVRSEGMILAEDELGIGTDHDGIMVLDELGPARGNGKGPALHPGAALAEVLPIATDVLELEITPNRPDCLSVYGLAREAHAITGAPLGPAPWAEDLGSDGPVEGVTIEVLDPDLCPRFTARAFEDVTIGPSPAWLKARLMAAGQRPINNVVDITNYVMLLTGQPLHAFDLDQVPEQHLIIRRATAGEEMETLDGQVRRFDEQMVLVCDPTGPSGIGGIMGGARSEVSDTTTRVLMEAATWNGPNIQRTSTRLALRTEASARFEKGQPPELTLEGQAVAAQLMVELCGARLVPGTIDVGGPGPEPAVITLRASRVAALLGRAIAVERCAEILTALGFGVSQAQDALSVTVPAFRRNDVSRKADLIEEVARVDGLDKLPATLPARRGATGRLTREQRERRRVEDALVDRGVYEEVGWSFTEPALADRLRLAPDDPRRAMVPIANPMATTQSHLRTTLLGSLLDVARHNAARGAERLRFFETGATYFPGEDKLPSERRHLGLLVAGDFSAAKGLLEAVLATLRVGARFERGEEPFLHPGRAAAVHVGGERIGWLGEIHPGVAGEWDLPEVSGFELDLDVLVAEAPERLRYRDVTTFPPVRRDLSLSAPDTLPAQTVLDLLDEPLITARTIFDVYTGEQAGQSRYSLAIHLTLQAPDRTLTDDEANAVIARALEKLGEQGVTQRA